MPQNLVIVESPAKAKTIEKFLGPQYVVSSSIGHIRDMPKKGMGIDIDNNFTPTYEVSPDKKKIVSKLRQLAKKADKVYLATDEDREGEAIAWHLLEALKLPSSTPRIVFHEITKTAITSAIKNPRTIDYNLVNAQQARRIIDRLVGFEISPVLWRKVSGAKSAGRVQSPVVRIIVEREREIKDHQASSVFKLKAVLKTTKNEEFEVKLNSDFATYDEALKFSKALLNADFNIANITTKPIKRSSKPPFTTSSLQQEASQKLGFSVKQTSTIAQNLYRDGFISYIRTDSFTLSEEAISAAEAVIKQSFGEEFSQATRYKTKSSTAQEAHEAIRPTDLAKSTIPNKDAGAMRLYQLIYKRTIASQMADAELLKTTVKITISSSDKLFQAEGEILKFAGFLQVYDYSSADDKLLPELSEGDNLSLENAETKQVFSRSKPRYTEASLVKKIEEMGIGRPSTFASMVSTVQDRGYITKDTRDGIKRDCQLISINQNKLVESIISENSGAEKNKLFPTAVAYLMTDFLVKYFTDIIDFKFTANLESDFDKIASETKIWNQVIAEFYASFHPLIEAAADIKREDVNKNRELGSDPKSGKPVTVRFGRFGPFAQIGDKDDEEKPTFASLKKSQDLETITLTEALDLFNMPRTVGETKEFGVIKANYGRFGPYIMYNKKYVSLKEISPEEVGLDEALILIAAKEKFDAERIIKTFEGSEIQILNGRFGPYIWNGKKKGKGQKNITIKKFFGTKNPADLTIESCQQAISGKLPPKKPRSKKPKKPTKK